MNIVSFDNNMYYAESINFFAGALKNVFNSLKNYYICCVLV